MHLLKIKQIGWPNSEKLPFLKVFIETLSELCIIPTKPVSKNIYSFKNTKTPPKNSFSYSTFTSKISVSLVSKVFLFLYLITKLYSSTQNPLIIKKKIILPGEMHGLFQPQIIILISQKFIEQTLMSLLYREPSFQRNINDFCVFRVNLASPQIVKLSSLLRSADKFTSLQNIINTNNTFAQAYF